LAKVTPHNPKDTATTNYTRNVIFSAKPHTKRIWINFPFDTFLASFTPASFYSTFITKHRLASLPNTVLFHHQTPSFFIAKHRTTTVWPPSNHRLARSIICWMGLS